ncbi:choice-of-anchor Q domain-containing protein [Limimaricola sp. AA108-03]|uniref:choice-of-anchor Q domain-containing protein n=1 Tax=Limimaricola sp. AA108-03 TaxID=3425945 RepID=UPI003D7734CD
MVMVAFRIEAESFNIIEGFKIESLSTSSGGQNLKALNKTTESRAEIVFSGTAGIYDLDIGHYDENDGTAGLRLFVNGVEAGGFVLDRDLGNHLASEETHLVRRIGDVALQPGDVIELRGARDGDEPVRLDYVDFSPAGAAQEVPSLTVTTLDDVVDGSDGQTSLREAIGFINDGLFAPGSTIRFADAPGEAFEAGGTITYARGSGPLTLTQSMTIDGDLDDDGMPDVTIDAQRGSRVFRVDDGDASTELPVILDGLILTNGAAPEDEAGGGVENLEDLSLLNSAVTGSSAYLGGGISNAGTFLGQGIMMSGNRIDGRYGAGGGLFNTGTMTLAASEIRENTGSYAYGAGVFNRGDLTVTESTISDNRIGTVDFGAGGGLYHAGGHLLISRSTISGNEVTYGGDGQDLFLGGFFGSNPTARIENSTISGPGSHPLVSAYRASLDLVNSTLAGGIESHEAMIRIGSTIVESASGDGFLSLGNNLIANGDGANGAFQDGVLGDIVGTSTTPVDPKLLPLRLNGGPTATHEPLADSPVLDAGANPDGLTTDQRGKPRDSDLPGIGGTTDIGAVELDAAEYGAPPPATTLTVDTTLDVVDPGDGLTSLREAIEAVNRGAFAPGSTIGFADGPGEAFAGGGTIVLGGTALDIAQSMVIDGDLDDDGTADVVIDADGLSRVATIARGSGEEVREVVLDGLVLTNAGADSAIYNQEKLTMRHSEVRDGVDSGVWNRGDLSLLGTTVDGHQGTGIFNDEGSLDARDSTISNNLLWGLFNSTGGALRDVAVVNSTFSGNGYDGHIFENPGGIYNRSGEIGISNSTITENVVGVYLGGPFEEIPLSEGVTRIASSIIAGNGAADTTENGGTAISLGHNLVGDGSIFSDGINGDIVGTIALPVAPFLSPLADNGGPTLTHLPGSLSPALDAGANPLGLATDQRGAARDIDLPGVSSTPDIGAVELRIDEFASMPPPEPFRVEAEDLTRDVALKVKALAVASSGKVLQADGSGEQRASYLFDRPGGVYDLTLGYFDETDGISTLAILVDGVAIDSWLWDQNLGSPLANAATATSRHISGVTIDEGSRIELVGRQDGSEPLRVDHIDFRPARPDTVPPRIDAVLAPDIGAAQAGAPGAILRVTYSDNVAIDVSSIGAGDIQVSGPGSLLVVSGVEVDHDSDGTPRSVDYIVNAPGGSWDAADNGFYSVTLNALEVHDTSGNPVPVQHALATFGVDVSASPPAPFRIEAEDLARDVAFKLNSLGAASAGAVLQADGRGEQRTSYMFDRQEGFYDLTIGYFDETDGVSNLSVLVDGREVESWAWDQDLGSPLANGSTATSRLISKVAIGTDERIELVGQMDGSEPLRIDYIDFSATPPDALTLDFL